MKRKAVWISCISAALFCGRSANASVIITLDQVGPNVVATDSGTINLTDLTFVATPNTGVEIIPSFGFLSLGEPTVADNITINEYSGVSGPTEFGTFIVTTASTSTGSQRELIGLLFFGVAGLALLKWRSSIRRHSTGNGHDL